ncbi:hypothetical protein [Mucilaginibacter defluvii]|uniref:DUF4340 domain-containing protein n=1 Tax=Mucilaginibacter defluvii TaxID=1196019 RepID=A0ABP9FUE2_9SPHI
MHSLKFTGILFAIFLIPFVLRLFGLEPYPAILFPSGPETVKQVNGKTKIETKQLFAKNQNGQWALVEPKAFMYPVSAIQLAKLVSKNMGFKKQKPFPLKGKIGIVNYLYRSQNSSSNAAEDAELRNWIKKRLKRGNYQTSEVKVATYSNVISTTNGNILKKELKDEKYYKLD